MYLSVKKMIADNKFIYFILANFLFLSIAFRCSHGKFINPKITEEIRTLRKGDLISVELVNQQKLNGVFLKNAGSSIIIATMKNGIITRKLISLNSIHTIQKHGKKSSRCLNALIMVGLLIVSIHTIQKHGKKSSRCLNALIMVGLLIVFLGLLAGTMLLSYIGSSYYKKFFIFNREEEVMSAKKSI